ncbi:hypothetical protein PIB30_114607, partial [Stylosanthes scabra]|nr:hypothetical protein [Stylosanthes scabra]
VSSRHRVKRQFGGEHPVPMDPVNLEGFLSATARGDDRWWPDELAYCTAFGATGCLEIIRFRSCPPGTPVGPVGNTLTGGRLPVASGS